MTYPGIERRWRREERTERSARSAERCRRLLVEGVAVVRRYGVRAAWLFGSVAEGTARQESDVDLLAIPVTASDYWALRRDLEAVLGCPIDLYSQDDAAVFVRKAMDRGELVYGHLERLKVPVPHRDVPPFSSAQALENEAKRKSHFSLRVLKNPRDGIFQGPLE